MIGKSVNQDQKHLFLANLDEFINPSHELCLVADQIDWELFENEFASLYSETGAPAKPVRLMTGLLILKQLYNLGEWKRFDAVIYLFYFDKTLNCLIFEEISDL